MSTYKHKSTTSGINAITNQEIDMVKVSIDDGRQFSYTFYVDGKWVETIISNNEKSLLDFYRFEKMLFRLTVI